MDTRTALDREAQRYELRPDAFERLIRRRDRKERNRRVAAATLAIIVALVSFAALTRAFRSVEHPASEPSPKPPGIFSGVGGWIAYGNKWGIWAVDPSHPGDGEGRVQLSSVGGIPLAWSSDGSELLISREFWVLLSRRQLRHGEKGPASRRGLFVLHADGTETHLVREEVSGASFSPDGTTVVFAPSLELETRLDPGIYLIDADGGVPRLLVEPSRRYIPEQDRSFRTGLYFPTFSPDGTQIAYFDGFGDNSHSLRLVNADGSDLRVLIENMEAYRISNLVWSPDGTRLAFGRRIFDGIYTIGVDGSGLTLVIPDGEDPQWSPDGSRISFEYDGGGWRGELNIADGDGSHIQNFGYAASGPWNPLVQPEPEVAEVPPASRGLTLTWTLVLVAALLTLVVGVLVIRRRMGPDAGNAI
jgi:WD40-like Beta Propeller Repeat